MNSYTQTQTITQTITTNDWKNYAMEHGKKVIYLVLRKKSFSKKINEKINEELEKKLSSFALKIIEKLQKVQPKDPENFIKYLMLKGSIKILEKIMKDNFLILSEEDKIATQKMFEEGNVDEEMKIDNEEEKKHKGDNNNFKSENNGDNSNKKEPLLNKNN